MENFKNINDAVEALEQSKKMAEALNKTAAVFLSSSTDIFENMMSIGMGIIADAADLDRLNLWRNYKTQDGLFASQIYRWDRAAGGTTEPTEELKSVSYSLVAPEWEKIFKNDESVNSPVSQITGNEGKMMNAFGAKSVFVTPIFIKTIFWGFLLYSDHRNERFFNDCCVDMMKSAAFLCANAVIRSEMERDIVSAHKLNRAIIDSMPIGMALISGNPPAVFDCNEELTRMFNAPKQEIIKNYFKDFAPMYLKDGRIANHDALDIMTLAMNGETVKTERYHQKSDGTPMPCDLTLTRVKDEKDFLGLGFLYDLTELKKHEIELTLAKEVNELQLAKLNLVIKSTKIGLWDMEIVKDDPINLDNTVVFSDDIRKMLGYTNEEDYPNKIRTWGEGLHPEDRDRAVQALTEHLLDKTGNTP